MTKLLRIDVSSRGAHAHSRRFADEAVERLQSAHGVADIVHRDLGSAPAAPIDAAYVHAMLTHRSREASEKDPALAHSEQLIGELENSDVLLISAPVHNYTVPASLKSWIDQVVRIGRTFEGTPTGKRGLLADRPTYVIAASGGYFSGDARQPDFFTPYLDAIFASLGIRSVNHIRLEGLTRGDVAISAAFENARARLASLATRDRPPASQPTLDVAITSKILTPG